MRWRRRRGELEHQAQVVPAKLLGLALAAQVSGELERARQAHAGELERQAALLQQAHAGELERITAAHAGELERLRADQAERELEAIERGLEQGRELEREAVRQENRARKQRARVSRDTPGPVTPGPGTKKPTAGRSRDTPGPVTPGPGTGASGEVVPAPPRLAEVPREPNARAGAVVLPSREPGTDGALALAPQPAPPPVTGPAVTGAPRVGDRARGSVGSKSTFGLSSNPSSRAVGFGAPGAQLLADFDHRSDEMETESVAACRVLLERIAGHRLTNRGTVSQLLGWLAAGAPPFAFRDALAALEYATEPVPKPAAYVCGVIRRDHAATFPGRRLAATTSPPEDAGEQESEHSATEAREACRLLREQLLDRSAALT